jgi:hypothetical protein
MGAWRWVVARASEFGEVSLAVILSVVAGLMFATACGAPDEVMRGQAQLTGGNTGGSSGGALSSSSSSGGTTTVAGSTASSTLAGGAVGPGGAGSSGSPGGAGGSSSVGGNSTLGGATTAGGSSGSGGISTTGGKGSGGAATGGKGSGGAGTGGKASGGAATGGIATGGSTASSTSSTGGTTFPFGGTTDAGGAGGVGSGGVATGGTTRVSSGGAGGSSGGATGSGGATSTSAPATGALQVWVGQKTTGSTGQIALVLRIDNKTSASVDMSTTTLRYWYQDEGLGANLVFSSDYVSIGYSNQGTISGKAVAASPASAGADHYLEISFIGTLAAQGDKATDDQFNVHTTAHTAGYSGTVDVTNDYSYDGGAAAVYEQKITLHDKSGKVIWGTAPK